MYLLTLAGLAPIQKVHRLEKMIPLENVKVTPGDLRGHFAGEIFGDASSSSDHYTTEEAETSGRDTDYERADDSSDESEKDENTLNETAMSGDFLNASNSKRKRHHKSESMTRRRKRKLKLRRARSSGGEENSVYGDEDETPPGSARNDES